MCNGASLIRTSGSTKRKENVMSSWSKTVAVLLGALILILINIGCEKNPATEGHNLSESQQEEINFLIPKKGKIRRTIIRVKDTSYEVDVITLSIGIINKTSKPQDINVPLNIKLIHPEYPDVLFTLLKEERGPYIVHLEPGEKILDIELKYAQQPESPILTSEGRGFVLMSLPAGHTLRVNLTRVMSDT